MKRLITLACLLLSLKSIAQFAVGDVLIIGANFSLNNDNQQTLIFVALDTIQPGTILTFTDIGYYRLGDSGDPNGRFVGGYISDDGYSGVTTIPVTDGYFRWTAGNKVNPGQVITIYATITGGLCTAVTSSDGSSCQMPKQFIWEADGDQILVYRGNTAPINTNVSSFLCGYSCKTGWGLHITDIINNSNSHKCDKPYALEWGRGSMTVPESNAYFANGPLPKEEVTMFMGRKQALGYRLLGSELCYASAELLEFPTYDFKILSNESPVYDGTVLAGWNFNEGNLNNEGTGSYYINGTTGNVQASLSNETFSTQNYPLNYDISNPAGIVIPFSTAGYTDIDLSFDLQMGLRAANSLQLHYSFNNQDWLPIEVSNNAELYLLSVADTEELALEAYSNILRFTLSSSGGVTPSMRVKMALPSSINNQPGQTVYIKISTTADPSINDYKSLYAYSSATYNYTRSTPIEFDNIQFHGTPIVLPLEFISFSAVANHKKVQLEWMTANEENIARFDVEKSIDNISYTTIASVPAKNQILNNYSYVDNQFESGTAYYRIKSVDLDATFSYSSVKAITLNNKVNTFTVAPTLVSKGMSTISLNYPKVSKGSFIAIVDMHGQKVFVKQIPEESMQTQIETDQLAAGTYFIILENGGTHKRSSARFIKQ